MERRIAVIKQGFVINVVITEDEGWEPETAFDALVEDTDGRVGIGDLYSVSQGIFYRPLATPPDLPDELQGMVY